MADLKPDAISADAISEQPAAPTPTAAAPAKPPQVRPGYKIVNVRKPDGTIVRVEQPVDPAAVDGPAGLTNASQPSPGYKIVKVRKPDGTIVRVKRPIDPATVDASAKGNAHVATSGSVGAVTPKGVNKAPVVPASTPAAAPVLSKNPAPKTTAPEPTAQVKTATAPTTTSEKATPVVVSEKPTTIPKTTTATPIAPAPAPTPTPPAKDSAALQPPINTPGPLTNAVLQAVPKLGLLARIGRHTSRVAGAFIPDLDIGEWEEGDDVLEDEPDSDDDDFGDGGDDRPNDAEDSLDRNSESRDTAMSDEKHGTSGAGSAATSYILNGVSQIPQQRNGANQQARSGPTVAVDKKGPAVENKEINNEGTAHAGLKPPRQLSRRPDWTRYIIWAIMILLPLLFLVLGILVAVINGRPEDSALGNGVTQALKVGVSAWPIIFAAVAAQSLKAFASYKVERGIRLMTLEQLISSNSVASSLKQPFILRRFDWITLALFALWGLSPLAGQAMVRVSYVGSSSTTSPVNISYVNTDYKNLAFGLLSRISADNLDYTQTVNRLYAAAFFPKGVNQNDGLDVWNYPLIPVFEEITTAPDSQGWYGINSSPNMNYSSIYGIPMVYWDGKNRSEYSFVIESAYLRLNCSIPQPMTMEAINATGVRLASSASKTLWMGMNHLLNDQVGNLTFASKISRNQTDTGSGSGSNTTEPSLNGTASTRKRQSSGSTEDLYAYSQCTINQTFVQTQMLCQGNLCAAQKMKRNSEARNFTAMGDFTAAFLAAQGAGYGQAGLLTDTEQYMKDPASVDKENKPYYDLSTLPGNVFTQRLSLLFNTFWQLGFAPPYQTGGLVDNPPDPISNTVNPYGIYEDTAAGTRSDFLNTYTTSWGWLAALFLSSVVLLIAGMAAVIWDAQTIVPDILGFASSVARKSKYVDLPKMDSAMSGAERSRLLGDVKVMMQDVKPGADVGRVALGTAHERAERLKPGRMYR